MTCTNCNGHMVEGTIDRMMHRDHTYVVVTNVPALICQSCGERFMRGDVVAQLQGYLAAAVAQKLEIAKRSYTAA